MQFSSPISMKLGLFETFWNERICKKKRQPCKPEILSVKVNLLRLENLSKFSDTNISNESNIVEIRDEEAFWIITERLSVVFY